ncbi:Inner membrane protein YebS [Lacunisphaera limnophila]|uniref:Inner membrane protein YebS n=1 Tax=Lacunisphaera limnophila TaxID=1838286 RepID=A0A1D8ARW5_9BACT|nr:paraquat-inducible protein A [Lacunisphaera limnophila]AOS43638.1 Inner membrane protein YebS [Lacunisphaera limnophila]
MHTFPGSGGTRAVTGRSPAALAWSLTGLILLLVSLQLPFVAAAKFGRTNEGRMFSGIASLWHQGHVLLAALVAFCGLVAPLLLLGSLTWLALRPGGAGGHPLRRFARWLEPWSMPDVRLLAILVAFVKLSALVEAAPAAGLWCYGATAVCTLLALRALPSAPAETNDRPANVPAAAACGLGALCLLVPAYSLPVMSFTRLGHEHADTLLTSVLKLWHGGLWGIALIVFTASLLVPVLKLLALGVLLAAARWPGLLDPAHAGRLQRLVHGIGRWSMLDVFLVAFLCGLVQFGSLARIEARPGVVAFAGAVILTMLATSALESTRRPLPSHP